MSKDTDGREQQDPPMLVLGEDRPDVEDTTPQQLREQKAELERRRQELKEQAERDRERAQEQLASERRAAEQALAERQREIDDAERRLLRTERRLRQKAARLGTVTNVPSVASARSEKTKEQKNSLLAGARRAANRRVPRASTALALLAVAAITFVAGVGGISSAASSEQVSAFVALDEADVTLREATLALDAEIVHHSAGREVPRTADGELRSLALTRVGLSNEANGGYYLERYEEDIAPTLEAPLAGPVQTVAAWEEGRDFLRYAVGSYEVEESRDALAPGSGWGTVLLWAGVLTLVGAAVILFTGGSRLAAAFTVLALGGAAVLLTQDPVFDRGLAAQRAEHEEAIDVSDDVVDQVGSDLQVVLGLRRLEPWELEEEENNYWRTSYRLESTPLDGYAEFAAARAALGESLAQEPAEDVDGQLATDEQAVADATLALVQAGDTLRASTDEEVAQLRQAVVEQALPDRPVGLLAGGLLLVLGLPVVGLVAESLVRARKAQS